MMPLCRSHLTWTSADLAHAVLSHPVVGPLYMHVHGQNCCVQMQLQISTQFNVLKPSDYKEIYNVDKGVLRG